MNPFARWERLRGDLSELCLSVSQPEDKAEKGQPKAFTSRDKSLPMQHPTLKSVTRTGWGKAERTSPGVQLLQWAWLREKVKVSNGLKALLGLPKQEVLVCKVTCSERKL